MIFLGAGEKRGLAKEKLCSQQARPRGPLQQIAEACTEVQGLSCVGSTGGEGSKPRLWNLRNLGPVPPYGLNSMGLREPIEPDRSLCPVIIIEKRSL